MTLIVKLAIGAALAGTVIGYLARIQGLALLVPILAGGAAIAFVRHNNATEVIIWAVVSAIVTAQIGYALGSYLRSRRSRQPGDAHE